VWVRGEHDLATKVSLAVTVARAAQLDDVPLLVDLSAVTFMDASTVGVIVASRNRLRLRRQSLEVRAPSPQARRVLELCGLSHLVHRDAVHTTNPGAALGTWVDVRPIQPKRGADHEPARVTARPATQQRDRVLAASVHLEEAATAEVDRGGP
jgi:anti-sigma B factor antagonist